MSRTALTYYHEVQTLEEAEISINVKALLENWRVLVPPTPLMKPIKTGGGILFMQTGFWYILHKFHATKQKE